MVALSDAFLSPLGLAAAALVVPIVALYLIRPDPERVSLPTMRFLAAEERQRTTRPLLERLARSLLLLLQVLAVLVLAAALAEPYVAVSERAVVEETVLVVDTSASMATVDGKGGVAGEGEVASEGVSRFDRAIAAAREEVTDTTTVVTTTGEGVVLRRAPPDTTDRALRSLTPTDAPGDLAGAIAQARSLAGEDVRVVVVSDFASAAGDRDWVEAVRTTRAQGTSLVLRQFGTDIANVGVIDRRFAGSEVTLTVKNFGEAAVSRTVELGDQRRTLDLGPGAVGSVTLPVPAGGGRVTLTPGDAFAVDDSVPIAAPADPTVDALVVTNDPNRFLLTALDVLDQVTVSVARPPTTIENDYDVVIYSNVDGDALLPGNIAAGRTTLADGGGVAIQAQRVMPDYDGLSLLAPAGVETGPTVRRVGQSELTRGIEFQPPQNYQAGSLRRGRALLETDDGTPLLATAREGPGRVLYYGYIEGDSTFKFNYQYPVFWKRAVFYLAGRGTLPELNHATGATVRFDADTVEGPTGPRTGPSVTLTEAGIYATENRRESAALLSERESAVAVTRTAEQGAVGNLTRTEERTVPRRLTEFAALAGVALVVLEVVYLGRRGDL